MTQTQTDAPPPAFVISREFDAPLDLLFAVQTTPEHIAHWMGGPQNFHFIGGHSMATGAVNHYLQKAPDGSVMYGRQTIVEVVPGEKIVLIQSFADETGAIAAHPMAPTWPAMMLATTQFAAISPTKTRMTVTWVPYQSDATGHATFDTARDSMTGGFGASFDQLAAYLSGL